MAVLSVVVVSGLCALRSPDCINYFLPRQHDGSAGVMIGLFRFARVLSPIKLLGPDDPVYQWRERLLDACSGYARKAVGRDV